MMIRLQTGNYVNSRNVRKIIRQKDQDGDYTTVLQLDQEGECLAEWDRDEVAAFVNDTFIAAEPGYKLILYTPETHVEFSAGSEDTVIAWRIDAEKYGQPKPVTLSGTENFGNPFVILCPNRQVIDQDNQIVFDDLSAWEAKAREEWAEKREKRLAEKKDAA